MSQTFYKEAGDRPAQDRLKAGTIYLPPLVLSKIRCHCSSRSGTNRG